MDPTNDIIKHLLNENAQLIRAKEKLYLKNKNLRQEVRNLNRANIDKLYQMRQLSDSVDYWKTQAGYTIEAIDCQTLGSAMEDSIREIQRNFDQTLLPFSVTVPLPQYHSLGDSHGR